MKNIELAILIAFVFTVTNCERSQQVKNISNPDIIKGVDSTESNSFTKSTFQNSKMIDSLNSVISKREEKIDFLKRQLEHEIDLYSELEKSTNQQKINLEKLPSLLADYKLEDNIPDTISKILNENCTGYYIPNPLRYRYLDSVSVFKISKPNPFCAIGDFNNDGATDYSFFVVHDVMRAGNREGSTEVKLVHITSRVNNNEINYSSIVKKDSFGIFQYYLDERALGVLKPGLYKFNHTELETKSDKLLYFTEGEVSSVIMLDWDGNNYAYRYLIN